LIPDYLFDFQKHLVEWAIRRGRAAIFANCGLGKTIQQLVWAENVVRHTNRPVLILTPLAVGRQTVAEAAKFGLEAVRSHHGRIPPDARIIVTNYEQLHHFNRHDFSGVVCDESSILKDFDGKRRGEITEFMREMPYRLLCTATAAPNDYVELGTSSEALGEMGHMDMIGRFFKQETSKDQLGWARTKYRLRGHAARDFWRWVCSWARSCRYPSDLGFDDGPFLLPELITREHEVQPSRPAAGMLFDLPGKSLADQREEQRRTLRERCEMVAGLVKHDQPAVAWCHLNDESSLLAKLIPDAVEVSGSDSTEEKEAKLEAFAENRTRVLVTKARIAGLGLNWQHCAHQTYFPSHSFEMWFQGIRRSWRFGQTRPVVIDVVTTPGSAGVLANLRRKAEQADAMFEQLSQFINNSLYVERSRHGNISEEIPAWLSSSNTSQKTTQSTTAIASKS
jgi:hypothetical protein